MLQVHPVAAIPTIFIAEGCGRGHDEGSHVCNLSIYDTANCSWHAASLFSLLIISPRRSIGLSHMGPALPLVVRGGCAVPANLTLHTLLRVCIGRKPLEKASPCSAMLLSLACRRQYILPLLVCAASCIRPAAES